MSFTHWFSEPLMKALGWTLIHSVWQLALIGVLLALVMIFLHRHSAQIRYQTALGAMTLMALASLFTFAQLYSDFSKPAFDSSNLLIIKSLENTNLGLTNTENDLVEKTSVWTWAFFQNYFEQNLPFIITVWFLGICVLTLRFLGGFAYTQRLRNYRTSPASEIWTEKMGELAYKLRISQAVRLLESAVVRVPMVIGYFRPLILLPLGISELSAKQIETILAHELAHIKRNDYFVNILQSLVEILFFYHPAVWWVSNIVRQERENCCDDMAVSLCGNSLEFAKALTYLEEIQISTPALAMALSGKKGHLFGRIKRLLERPATQSNVSEGLIAAFLVLFCFFSYGFTLRNDWNTDFEKVKNVTEKFETTNKTLSETKSEKANADLDLENNNADWFVFQDSTGKKHNLIVIKDKEGNITELYVDGKKIKPEDFDKYKALIDKQLAALPETDEEDVEEALDEVLEEVRKNKTESKEMIWVGNEEELEELSEKLRAKSGKLRILSDNMNKMKFGFDSDKFKFFTLDSLEKLGNLRFEFEGDDDEDFDIEIIDAPDPDDVIRIPHAPHASFDRMHSIEGGELGEMLLKDGLIKDKKKYTISLNKTEMKINGKAVSQDIADKYRRFFAEKQGKSVEKVFKDDTSFTICLNGVEIETFNKTGKGSGFSWSEEEGKVEREMREMEREAEREMREMQRSDERMQKEAERAQRRAEIMQRGAKLQQEKSQKISDHFTAELRKDGLINPDKFEFKMSNKGLVVDGKKQSDALFQKYKKIWEELEGKDFDKTFDKDGKYFQFGFSK